MTDENERLLKRYERSLVARGYKERGIAEKTRYARLLLDYLEENGLTCRGVGLAEAEELRERLSFMRREDGMTRFHPETINVILAHTKTFYGFLMKAGIAGSNPFADVERMKEAKKLPGNILSVEEMGKLLAGITVESRDDFTFLTAVELLYSTGCRISEIENLSEEDTRSVSGCIVVRNDKEGRDRIAPLTERAAGLLELYMKYVYKGGRVFGRGKRRTFNRWVGYRLAALCARLGLPLLTCHGIRHTIATHLFKAGADIREVQEFLGHRRLKNTEVYTRVLTEDLKEVLEKNHPREKDEDETRR
jgi:site-specific recombinase XerD